MNSVASSLRHRKADQLIFLRLRLVSTLTDCHGPLLAVYYLDVANGFLGALITCLFGLQKLMCESSVLLFAIRPGYSCSRYPYISQFYQALEYDQLHWLLRSSFLDFCLPIPVTYAG